MRITISLEKSFYWKFNLTKLREIKQNSLKVTFVAVLKN